MNSCDALIIGGGPAGAMCAAELAAAGRRTMVVEQHTVMPERVCGSYLCPSGVGLLERSGLVETLAPHTRKLRGMILHAPDFRKLTTHFPDTGRLPSHGLALRRPEFDERLLALAAARGADVRRGVRPVKFQAALGGWMVALSDGSRIFTHLLVGADGRKSATARMLGLHVPPARQRVALHVDLDVPEATPPFGEMHVFDDGSYVGINNIEPNRINFSTVASPAQLRGVSAAEFINRCIQASPHLSGHIPLLAPHHRVGATCPANHRVRDVIGHHAALIGDASGFVDPLTGEGVYMALWSATALADSLVLHSPRRQEQALQAYRRRRLRTHAGKHALNNLFQSFIAHPEVANHVLRLLSWRQGIGDAFIGLIGNNYSPPRAVWEMLRAACFPGLRCGECG